MLKCSGCGFDMTPAEAFYYGECEACARLSWEKVQRWKAGEPNAELDEAYGTTTDKPRTVH